MRPEPPPEPNVKELLARVGLFVLIAFLGVNLFPIVMMPLGGLLVASTLSTFAAGLLANAIAVRLYEHGRPADFGLGWSAVSAREFLFGAVCGAGAAVVILAGAMALRIAKFEKTPTAVEHPWAALAFVSTALFFGAAGEEMMFHGYAFQLLTRSVGAFATILPVSIVFGMAHLGNQHANLLGIVNTIVWGVLLGYACWSSGALWLPIGLHFGWNVTLPLLGANLSGFTMGVTGYSLHWSVGRLWSGGDYGPEGGLPTTLVVVALFWVVQSDRLWRFAGKSGK
jgi:membrane protease YdiL (CAAX protease family)